MTNETENNTWLAKLDANAKKQYPVGIHIRVKANRHWGKVIGYVDNAIYGSRVRDKAYVVVEFCHYPEVTQDYPLDAIEYYTCPEGYDINKPCESKKPIQYVSKEGAYPYLFCYRCPALKSK